MFVYPISVSILTHLYSPDISYHLALMHYFIHNV